MVTKTMVEKDLIRRDYQSSQFRSDMRLTEAELTKLDKKIALGRAKGIKMFSMPGKRGGRHESCPVS